MEQQAVVHDTFVVQRRYPAPIARVFAALADAEKKRRWFAEGENHSVEKYEMDFRIGGQEHLSYRFHEGTTFGGVTITSDGYFHDIVTNRRVVLASTSSFGGKRISTSLVTLELSSSSNETDFFCTHQGAFFEGADGPRIREAGWRYLLESLAGQLDT